MKRSGALVLVALIQVAPIVALYGCGDDSDGPGGPRIFRVDAEGSGPTNVEPLWPMHSGTLHSFRHAAVRPPVEIAPGRVASRYITQPDTLSSSASAESQHETWISQDERGAWFEGSTDGGLLDGALMLVPATVRVGMRWTTGSGGFERSYEVVRREELETALGPTVLWTTRQDTETPIFRTYAEGWGLVGLEAGFEPESIGFFQPLRVVMGAEPEPVQSTGPRLSLTPAPGFEPALVGVMERVDSVRAVRDGPSLVMSVVGVSRNRVIGGTLSVRTAYLELRDGRISGPDGQIDPLPGLPDAHYIRQAGIGPSYLAGSEGIFGLGNVLYVGSEVYYTVDDLLMFENRVGGVSGAIVSFPYPRFEYRFERPLVAPGFGPDGGLSARPIWGTFPLGTSPFRILIGDGATPASVPFARIGGALGELSHAHLDELSYGLQLRDIDFVEAFPDAAGTDGTAFRGARIDTTSAQTGQTHFFTTPGGVIDRIVVDAAGARRERLGRVDLPEGHVLRAVADAGGGALVVFTYFEDGAASRPYVWLTEVGAAAPVDPAPFVSVQLAGLDMRVCWPPTTAPLDSSDWRLGPARAAAVISNGANCALVVRDLEATPIPPDLDLVGFESPAGWGVFEGAIPGVGVVRAFEPGGVLDGFAAPASGAWLEGGGMVGEHCPDMESCAGLVVARDGVPVGSGVFMQFMESGSGVPDPSGAGMWLNQAILELPEGGCSTPIGCDAAGFTRAFVLSGGAEQAVFPLRAAVGIPGQLVRSGGVLFPTNSLEPDTGHRGPVHLRPDGTFAEITLTDRSAVVHAVRASGEVCGLSATGVFCSRPDGTGLRESAVPDDLLETIVGGGGWPLLDDDLALVMRNVPAVGGGFTTEPWLLDLESFVLRAYPVSVGVAFRVDSAAVGADGIVYGSITVDPGPSIRSVLGAFRTSGFVPLNEIYDVDALLEDPDASPAVAAPLVTGDLVVIQRGLYVLRIPRARWDGTACEPTTAPGLDADGDGYVADTSCGLDCDDGDPSVHPGASDPCGDGVDSNCDGRMDSGATCWQDADGDGFAPAAATTLSACDCPVGFTSREPTGADIDCFDGDDRMYPGQTEFFPGFAGGSARLYDYDCDGIDEPRWADVGACGPDPDACTTTDGWLGAVPACGAYGTFLGCVEPGLCGPCSRMFGITDWECAPPRPGVLLSIQQACR